MTKKRLSKEKVAANPHDEEKQDGLTWFSAFMKLEPLICDLSRMAKIVNMMTVHDAVENGWTKEGLAIVAAEQLENMTADVKRRWYDLHKEVAGQT